VKGERMARFRYRLQAALDRAKALEADAADALGSMTANLQAVLGSAALGPPGVRSARASDFAWSAEVDRVAGRRVGLAVAGRDAARRLLTERRRDHRAFSLHRQRCAAAFAAALERAAEAELDAVNALGARPEPRNF